MAKHPLWHDEYWLLLIQLYLKHPQGVKPLYSRGLVNLALELHILPDFLHRQMARLDEIEQPSLQQLWNTYAGNPRRLSRDVAKVRKMEGFGKPAEFYDGVEVNVEWEKLFKPIATLDGFGDDGMFDTPSSRSRKKAKEPLTPVKLIMILDQYFRLTPLTMVSDTPEVIELAKLIRSTPAEVTEILEVYQHCDPLLARQEVMISSLLAPCMQIWKRYGNDDPEKIASLAQLLKAYWA